MLYDKDIREPLFYYLEERFGKSRILEELNMGRSRADVVMVLPQRIVGLEIKSNADTYDRLERQVKDYNKFCDSNYIVTGLRHVKHVAGHIPDYWGILCIYEDNRKVIIDEVRPAADNPSVLKASQMSWLWKMSYPTFSHTIRCPGTGRKASLSSAKNCLPELTGPF